MRRLDRPSHPAMRSDSTLDLGVVVIPAHDEVANLPATVTAVRTAAGRLSVPVQIVVVLDACRDGSAMLTAGFGPAVHFIEVDVRNVGPPAAPVSSTPGRSTTSATSHGSGMPPPTPIPRSTRTG